MSLADAAYNKRMRITNIESCSPLSSRLMELGLVEGAEVEVVRRAPLGDPLQVRVGDYDLSVRSSEAKLVDVVAI
jgi:ferrous iron transport protein A